MLTASGDSAAGTGPDRPGNELSSRRLSRLPTLNSMTLSGMTSSPSGNGAFASLVRERIPARDVAEVDDNVEALGAMPIVRSL